MGRRDIIRSGDTVEVVDPQAFLRCGYPNSFDYYVKLAKETYPMMSRYRNRDAIYRQIAYGLGCADNFGGPDRSIHPYPGPYKEGTLLKVTGTRVVKTGTRYKGYGGSSYNAYDDAEPPGLSSMETHIIVGTVPVLASPGFAIAYSSWADPKQRGLEYPASHLKKVLLFDV